MHYHEMRNCLVKYIMQYGESVGIKDIINALNGVLFDLYASKLNKREENLDGRDRDKKDERD